MLPKHGDKLEGIGEIPPTKGQKIPFNGVELTATRIQGGKTLWEYDPPESNVIPIRPDDPNIPRRTIMGIMIVTREAIIRSVWRVPRKVYG